MFQKSFYLVLSVLILCACTKREPLIEDSRFYLKVIDLERQYLGLYWKDAQGVPIKSFTALKNYLAEDGEKLTFAMNGGMYLKDNSPQGLYINHGIVIKKLDTVQQSYGNFYLQPNGIFGITKTGKAVIQTTTDVQTSPLIYATQSGPMLVIDGALHPAFNPGSKNVHIRNAVGILPNGKLLFAISKNKINFYDLATFFKNHGCENALYLDGFVSRIYDPENGIQQMDGAFGVLIGITE